MARTPSAYNVELIFQGGERQTVRFPTLGEFQRWYQGELLPRQDSDEFLNVPLRDNPGEYLLVRPGRILALHLEPYFSSSL